MATGLDYSAGRPTGAQIRAAGFDFVIRYTWWDGQRQAYITPEEYADLTAAGVEVWLVHEVGTNDPLGGFDGGVRAATAAQQWADHIGYPRGRVIFFCFDRHALPSELPAWQSYLDGAASVIGANAVGAYGFSEALAAAKGHATGLWGCGAQSDVESVGGVHLYQWNNGNTNVGGITCDINYQLAGDLSALRGDDMPTAQEVADALLDTQIQMMGKLPDGSYGALTKPDGTPEVVTPRIFFQWVGNEFNATRDVPWGSVFTNSQNVQVSTKDVLLAVDDHVNRFPSVLTQAVTAAVSTALAKVPAAQVDPATLAAAVQQAVQAALKTPLNLKVTAATVTGTAALTNPEAG